MIKVNLQKHSDYVSYANNCTCGKVYPLSIALKYQPGDIFVDSESECKTVLFWHHCGFAFISGEYNEIFLASVYALFFDKKTVNPRRFVLFTDDERTKYYFSAKENIVVESRFFFDFGHSDLENFIDLPAGYELKPIDSELLPQIEGRITPYFSWDNASDFLSKGSGYCIVSGREVAAWAFSSAVSDDEIDIGVETQENHQHKGLASIVSKAMIEYCLNQAKSPVWACHCSNTASAKLAEKVGFSKTSECYVIRKNN